MPSMRPIMSSLWIPYFTVVLAALDNTISDQIKPFFNVSEINVTAIAGTTAVLPCSVIDIGDKRVAWLNPRKTLIATEDRRTMDDTRLSIERPLIPDWNLHIRSVRYEDRGMYTCTLNTDPVSVKRIFLTVLVPPDIDELHSSGRQTVREGSTVELQCNATGKPQPKITWFRKTIYSGRETKEAIGTPGDTLKIHNITRYCDGIYECVASNGVGRAVSKDIQVDVLYKPEVSVLNKKIKQKLGKETILSCNIAASPQGMGIWRRGNNVLPVRSQSKHRLELYNEGPNQVTLNLKILYIQEEDYGEYTCEASNKLGKDWEDMYLFELKDPTTTMAVTPRQSNKQQFHNIIAPPSQTPTTAVPHNPRYGIKNPIMSKTDSLEMGSGAIRNQSSSRVIFILSLYCFNQIFLMRLI